MLLDEGSFLEIDMFRQSQTVAAPDGGHPPTDG